MFRAFWYILLASFCVCSSLLLAQTPPASDPQAMAYAAQSIAALVGSSNISDVTLTGNATWNGTDTGTATLKALGGAESRVDLALSSGVRTEIRDAQTGMALGKWINNNASGVLASHNCLTDPAWFFPALSSLGSGPNVVLTYVGQERRNGGTVQHIQSYIYPIIPPPPIGPTLQQLSTIDFYLDAGTLLPVSVTFNAHPDSDASTNLLIEIDFSNYQSINGIAVPTHIEKYQQGNLLVDLAITGASFNTGLSLSNFTIN